VQVPSQGYDLVVEPLVPNQELALRFFHAFTMYYWEGMCKVTGTHRGQPVTGKAYVEITNRQAEAATPTAALPAGAAN
jgi:predicted secreted hydrolase